MGLYEIKLSNDSNARGYANKMPVRLELSKIVGDGHKLVNSKKGR